MLLIDLLIRGPFNMIKTLNKYETKVEKQTQKKKSQFKVDMVLRQFSKRYNGSLVNIFFLLNNS